MPFRLYDWECSFCKAEQERVVFFYANDSPPLETYWYCNNCSGKRNHRRLLALPGPYFGEKVLNPMVYGGKFDTAGYKSAPVPEYLPANAPYGERKEYYRTKEYKEVMAERKSVIKENKMKRKRAALISSGETINMRRDKLPGDPKVTS